MDYLRRGYFKDPKGYQWAFGVAMVTEEKSERLSALPDLSENPSVVGLLRVADHPIWPVCKSDGEWRLTVDYRGLNEVRLLLSTAVPDMLELQYELESKTAKCYATTDIANVFFSIPLAAECRLQFTFTWRDMQYTWNRLPQGWLHSPTIFHGLIQATLEKGKAPEHIQYIDDIIVWGDIAEEVLDKGKKIMQILLKAGSAIKKSKVKGPVREIQFLRVKWQDARQQIPTDVINKIVAMDPPTNKKETQAFLGAIGFWRMHIPEYNHIIKQEIAHAVALGPVKTGPDVKNVLYSVAGDKGPSWSLWQKAPGGNFSVADEEEEEPVTRGEEAPPYNQLPEEETRYALFTDDSCCIAGRNRKWKAAVCSPTRRVVEATEGDQSPDEKDLNKTDAGIQ
ncbi:hypothetical protein BTVI_43867 [Pitangus sulphuratus]|nr:hypothetical protein BTVI_43867 [Pitangus sulphuratus]